MDPHEQWIVRFLSQPAAYPHPVGRIERRQTHVSHVFLAGSFAYKLKKPVRFPFLDASTLARRKRFCQLELTLNRRLAQNVYVGIVPITEAAGRLQLGGTGRVIEWVVKMRRLPEERMLDRLVALGRVSRSDMDRLADRLVPFFKRAERSRTINRYGTPEAVAVLVLGNLEECRPFVGRILPEADRHFLEAAYRQFLALHELLLARRLRERRIIDGHGDLRCENICLTEPVSVFDCVEFQPAFRCGDLVNDFSFLVMDLEFRGREDLASTLVEQYRRRMGDRTFANVLTFYKCHRSLVRGKVRGFAWLQHPNTAEGRRIRNLARHHFQLAVRYARRFAPPRLIIVGGLIGTGKSTLARSLAQGLGAAWLRTDEIRLREFAHTRRSGQGFSEGIYAARVSQLVYQRLIQRAETLVRQGRSVVCDGTFSKAEGRQALREIARRHGASFHFFECVVPRAVALRRVATRYAKRSDLSEARPEHYDRLKAGFEPVRGWSGRDWTRLSDNRPPEATARAALARLRQAWYNDGKGGKS
jgi:aminoglycoside phosphotransferase family enzyme/predicted kinase